MTARVLPFEEWEKIDGIDEILMGLRPGRSQVIVVEDQGAIVGRLLLFPVLHAECLWIAPTHRKTVGVMRRLVEAMRRGARQLGFDRVWGASDSDDMTRILAHPKLGGLPIPALSVVLPVERVN